MNEQNRSDSLLEMAHCAYYERLVLMGHTPGLLPLWVRTATPPEEDET